MGLRLRSHTSPPVATLAFVLATISVNPGLVRAQCVEREAKDVAHLLQEPRIELVFGGTVTSVERTSESGYRATFAVDRVWKGTIPNLFAVYVLVDGSEAADFRERQQRIVVAQKIVDPRIRAAVGADSSATVAFIAITCNAGLAERQDAIERLGPPHAPKIATLPTNHDGAGLRYPSIELQGRLQDSSRSTAASTYVMDWVGESALQGAAFTTRWRSSPARMAHRCGSSM